MEFAQKTTEKRKTLVSPWKNKDEFESVYKWLFGEEACSESKQKACRKMMIWKARRLDLTPASVLATLVVVEVQIKDARKSESDKAAEYELQVMYSSALTRFFNYMSSVVQTRNMKSMYDTAKDLGLDSFLVDLRHICAHGQTLPSLDIFRRTSEYCVNWLRGYFWENELANYRDCDSRDIRLGVSTNFDENVTRLFGIYDIALEGILRDCEQLVVAKNRLTRPKYDILQAFSKEHDEVAVAPLLELVVKQLSALVKREPGLKDLPQILIEALLKMKYFFEFPAEITNDHQIKSAIKATSELFRAIAMFGFIEDLFQKLVGICENNFEEAYRRKGASFWANQIVLGFVAFKKFKCFYKAEKDLDPKLRFDLRSINSNVLAKDVKNIYSKINVDIEKTFIFGDNFRRPWFLAFDRAYIEERVAGINELTAEILKNSLHLVEPTLPEEKLRALESLINVFLELQGNSSKNGNGKSSDKIYTINDLEPEKNIPNTNDEMMEVDSNKHVQKFGIWSVDCAGPDWHTCPIGKLIWE